MDYGRSLLLVFDAPVATWNGAGGWEGFADLGPQGVPRGIFVSILFGCLKQVQDCVELECNVM